MTPTNLTSFRNTLVFVLMFTSISSTFSQSVSEGTEFMIAKEGLEATLRIVACGDNSAVTIEWKNQNTYPLVVVLTLRSESNHSLLLMTTARVEANATKSESCADIDLESRSVEITNFNDVTIDMTIPHN